MLENAGLLRVFPIECRHSVGRIPPLSAKSVSFLFLEVSWLSCDRARLAVAPYQKKSARELRQGGSNYRCCIPALAGFVSPQSIAPDGGQILLQTFDRATLTAPRGEGGDIDKVRRFCLHRRRETFRVAFTGFSLRHHEFLYNAR